MSDDAKVDPVKSVTESLSKKESEAKSDSVRMLASQLEPILINRLQNDKPIDDIEKTLKAYKALQDSTIEKDRQAFLREKALRKESYYFSFLVSILVPLLVIVLAVSRLSENDDKVNLYLLGAGSGILAVSSSAWLSDQAQSRRK
ncbi:MAG: hypothetical protein AAFP07_13080 [Cyanobacteria bacterium J06606_4]